ncbi:hypothetical protein Goari_005168 [Gossypium aridum]|uniref:Tyrosinase copper-binding domain-containing protein n=1 Tax=Gossypium aridum TaxID=34290 RepID=A0A7J8Y5Q3_GOSAI|nr:hypothetical protein [Gossypium aridum]
MNVPCCPPKLKDSKIIDFEPPLGCKIRYRPAAHLVDRDYLYKFESAMERMKALPVDDPRNFMQQANIHCAYCNGAYSQVGFPDQKLEVHYSWLFFPFHRMYLYFFERILGKLIDDPDFAMPFWNWDSPCGMTMPQIYLDPYSPLDPLFYAHHGNVDRMWNIWKTLPGKKRRDFDENVWLNSSFLFYDENANMVRVKVRDCLDSKTLGYDYQSVDIPWLRSKPTPRRSRPGVGRGQDQGQDVLARRKSKYLRRFPIVLDKVPVRIEILRPKKPINKKKDDKEEVLVLQNIQLDRNDSVQFDVSINDDEDDDNPCKPEDAEFVGSFSNLPHGDNCHSEAMLSTNLYLPLSEALEDLKINPFEDSIVVTLVPKEGEVSIGNIKIDYVC